MLRRREAPRAPQRRRVNRCSPSGRRPQLDACGRPQTFSTCIQSGLKFERIESAVASRLEFYGGKRTQLRRSAARAARCGAVGRALSLRTLLDSSGVTATIFFLVAQKGLLSAKCFSAVALRNCAALWSRGVGAASVLSSLGQTSCCTRRRVRVVPGLRPKGGVKELTGDSHFVRGRRLLQGLAVKTRRGESPRTRATRRFCCFCSILQFLGEESLQRRGSLRRLERSCWSPLVRGSSLWARPFSRRSCRKKQLCKGLAWKTRSSASRILLPETQVL